MKTELETVNLIASGYEWTCPNCDKLNLEIEVTRNVKCRRTWSEREYKRDNGKGCGREYETESPEHAYS